jgi:type IV secretion system protein VirD4
MRTWAGPIVAVDIKGELLPRWEQIKDTKRPAKVLSLSIRHRSHCRYDPYCHLRQDGEDNLVSNVRELANAIEPLPLIIKEPFWITSARSILTAAILHCFSNNLNFVTTMIFISSKPISSLISEIATGDNEVAKMHITPYIDLDDSKMLSGIAAELNNHILTFATDMYVMSTLEPSPDNENDDAINWHDLETYNIFLSVPESKLEQYGCVLTVILTQLIRHLERRPDKYSPMGKGLPPILLLLNEFPRLGKMDVILNALATLRSRGVTICLMVQSIAQLDFIYGKEARRIILDNCQYKAILSVADADSQLYFSNLVGSIKTGSQGFSTSHLANNYEVKGYNLQMTEAREPIIFPHEFATLDDVVLITPHGYCRVAKAPYYAPKNTDTFFLPVPLRDLGKRDVRYVKN